VSDTTQQLELMVQELQNRIGQITSQYETELAAIKVQAHLQIQQLQGQVEANAEAAKPATETKASGK
jgi:hypothetical protein